MFYDLAICRQCFMEGFEGSSMAGAGSTSVYVGTCQVDVVNVRTCGKSVSCFCEGSS